MSKGMQELRAEWERAAAELAATTQPALRSEIRANMRDIALAIVPALLAQIRRLEAAVDRDAVAQNSP